MIICETCYYLEFLHSVLNNYLAIEFSLSLQEIILREHERMAPPLA